MTNLSSSRWADSVRTAQADEVDAWLADRVEKLKGEADRKRQAHRAAAGKALQAMRLRGEPMAGISAATGLSVSRLREYLKYASENHDGATMEAPGAGGQVVALPKRAAIDEDGTLSGDAAVGAQ